MCKQCKKEVTYDEAELRALSSDIEAVSNFKFMRGEGCEACSGTGFAGRAGLYEVMAMSPEIRKLILQGASVADIRDKAVEEGMLTLRMDGIKKVERGITTLEEVVKETAE